MSSYTKLHNSLLASTIWREDDKTRIVWITLLVMTDRHGLIEASVPGIADLARVSVPDARAAIAKLQAPDADSRTRDHEGRRIEAVDGGWRIVNYEKYRHKLSAEDRLESKRQAEQARRDRQRAASTTETAGAVRRLRGKPVNGSEQAPNP